MLPELKKVYVTNTEIIGIFESEREPNVEYITKLSFTLRKKYCSCPDFFFRNDLNRYYKRNTYTCKHIAFLEAIIRYPGLVHKLVRSNKIDYDNYIRLIYNLQQYHRFLNKIFLNFSILRRLYNQSSFK